MPTYRTPGVYIEELPSGIRPIEGANTSIGAFVGRCLSGPIESPTLISSFSEFKNIFGDYWTKSEVPNAVQDFFANGGIRALVVRLHNSASPAQFSLPSSNPKEPPLELESVNPGVWGERLILSTTNDPKNKDLFSLAVFDPLTRKRESFNKLSCQKRSKYFIAGVLEKASQLIRVQLKNRAGQLPLSRPQAQSNFKANRKTASDGKPLQLGDFTSSRHKRYSTGLYALKKAAAFNLLCVPPYKADGSVDPALTKDAAALCEQNKAFHIIDPPVNWNSAQTAVNTIENLGSNSAYAAVFYPRIRKQDPLNSGAIKTYAPCGAIAGVFARFDQTRGVWKAPAGLEAQLNGIEGLSASLSIQDQELLNPHAINCMRTLPTHGTLLWGARTLQGKENLSSEWKYIPVRRLANYIETSIEDSLQWVAFEPNNETLWARIRTSLSNFLNTLWRDGAFQGSKPEHGFFVRCDRSTTSQADIDQGIVRFQIGFAPLKPAEFTVIRFQKAVSAS